MKNDNIEAIVKKIVLANSDFDIKGIAVVFINTAGDLEIELSFGHGHAFAINTGLDLLKNAVVTKIRNAGNIEPTERD